MKNFNLKKLIKPNKTLLGVGPMSLNCVKAASEVANRFRFPIMLIASRRQIDSRENGGGYVNNWNTENYSNFISSIDKRKILYSLETMEDLGRIILKLKKILI